MIRVGLGLNAGPRAGKAQSTCLVAPTGEAIRAEAVKKLRLKKKEAAAARLFLWTKDNGRGGVEIPQQGSVDGLVCNDDVVAVSFGEAYAGPGGGAEGGGSSSGGALTCSRWLRWEERPLAGSLAVVEWSDARTMNATLGRLSTLLEHPTFCLASHGRLVTHEQQRGLPSSKYLGHNLYAHTLEAFERLCGECKPTEDSGTAAPGSSDVGAAAEGGAMATSASEASFLQRWHARGSPQVVISCVCGETATMAHELCHARYALDAPYRTAIDACWSVHAPKLGRWMGDLGYHESRHADEFGAYLLTEAPGFWRGRLPPNDVKALRIQVLADAASTPPTTAQSAAVDVMDGGSANDAHERQQQWATLELSQAVPREDLSAELDLDGKRI